MSKVRFMRRRGVGSRDGYTVCYRGPMGDRQFLKDDEGRDVIFNKKDIYAGNYGAKSSESRRVVNAMDSAVWNEL